MPAGTLIVGLVDVDMAASVEGLQTLRKRGREWRRPPILGLIARWGAATLVDVYFARAQCSSRQHRKEAE